MKKFLKIAFFLVTFPAMFLFLDYVLPSKEVLRITSTSSRLTDIGLNRFFYAEEDLGASGAAGDVKRDVRFISAATPDGKSRVFRNEDTGWVYPPYFKYDSANLHADAAALVSGDEAPKWAMVTSYGWRIAWFSIFPNAVDVKRVDSPDESTVSIAALLVIGGFYAFAILMYRAYRRLIRRSIDPMLADFDARADAFRADVSAKADKNTKGIRDWLGTWKGKPRI